MDIGFGTGVLACKLYENGYDITGIDFSGRMIEIAQEKMPTARLIQHDFTNGLPTELQDQKFDAIVSTYAIHHLDDVALQRQIWMMSQCCVKRSYHKRRYNNGNQRIHDIR